MAASNDSRFLRANVPVFFGSALLILAAVAFAGSDPERAAHVFSRLQSWIVHEMGWFYVAAVATFLVFSIGLAVSSMGRIRLGPDDAQPDFSTMSWFSMLFSAGMGIGIMFYGVAEPILHYANPPTGPGGTLEAARAAMQFAFFHWGLHAWAVYAVVGLALAYFSFRRGLPLTVRSGLHPLLGDRINGWPGHLVDIFAVFGTMFGVATSLGLGVMQVNAGLNYLFDVSISTSVQIALIVGITLIATASVASGINAGIRRLSELNIILALTLMVFVLVAGPTVFLLQAAMQNTGAYLSNLVSNTFMLYAYEPNEWIGSWTLFYWGWWISWSPFVGMFIARISRGRTIREFIVGVLLVPAGFTVLWFTVFGNTALVMELTGEANMVASVQADVAVALFQFLAHLPLEAISMTLATILVVTFFVTSSDSGSLVIDIITTCGVRHPPVWQRVMWALLEGVVAAVLLLAGGLAALQTGAIASGFPLAIIILLVCYGLFRALREETRGPDYAQRAPYVPPVRGSIPWRRRLGVLLQQPSHERAQQFLRDTVVPALNAVAGEIQGRGLEVSVEADGQSANINVLQGEDTFLYAVKLASVPVPSFAGTVEGEREGPDRAWRAEVSLQAGEQRYDILGYTVEQVIADLIAQYERHMHHLALQDRSDRDMTDS
ncbi:MAG TPA: BCCT family transporter [Gammaproteobacteria bacterium]